MKAVFGLGNPGTGYEKTRHNIGRMVVSSWAGQAGIKIAGRRFEARTGIGQIGGQQVITALPQTYMNLSGRSVARVASYYRLDPGDIVVVLDDMDLELGKIRIRTRGSDGGHRGIRSIIEELGSAEFTRLRIGIGRPPEDDDTVDFVLMPFSAEEREIIDKTIERAREALTVILTDGVEFAMNEFNR
jgi:peptidyl-tRNA hydrolase, PTH1 family